MFNSGVWKPTIRATDIPDDRHNGMHVLRHTYASVLLDAGESIKALSAYPGPRGPGLHPPDLHPPTAGQRGSHRQAIDKHSVRTRPAKTLGKPLTAWTRHDHGSKAPEAPGNAVQRLCRSYFQRKCTKSLPKFFESFSTRW